MVTMGVDFVQKNVIPKGASEELNVKIWDTAG